MLQRKDPDNHEVIRQSYSLFLNNALVGQTGMYRDLPGHDKPMSHDRHGSDMMGLDHYLQQNGMDNYSLVQKGSNIVVQTNNTENTGIYKYLTQYLTHHLPPFG